MRSLERVGAVYIFFLAQFQMALAVEPPDIAKGTVSRTQNATNSRLVAATSQATGGLVVMPSLGPRIVFLNRQAAVPELVLQQMVNHMQVLCRTAIEIKTLGNSIGEPRAILERELAFGTNKVTAAIFIGDVKGHPSLLVAPDDRWAVVNISALDKAGCTEEVYLDRVRRELWRAVGLAVGGGGAISGKCVLGAPVGGIGGLENLGRVPGGDSLARIQSAARRLGAPMITVATYRRAVEAGWAPAPADDTQRAIWTELKAEAKK